MASERGSRDELLELLGRRPAGIGPLFRRYVLGRSTEKPLTKEELKEKLDWKDDETDENDRRIRLMRDELVFNMEGLREQFMKVGGVIALFALMIAFSLSGTAKEKTVVVICIAAALALWVQSPRLKIFGFRRRVDAALRVGAVKSQLDEYYYLYSWVNGREQTLHAAEVLVLQVTAVAIFALGYVAYVT